jgi:prepilin-type N-terminal cleavage/methylation domain-containing protein
MEEDMIASTRRGFTLIEMLIVVTIVGIMAFAVAPTGRQIVVDNAVRSAKQEIAASLAVARASAIHNGRPARFIRTGNVTHVTVGVGAQLDTMGAPLDMMSTHKVRVESQPDTIRFDPRGFATSIPGAYQTVRLYRGTRVDSVCVTRFGRIIAEGSCQ